MAQKHNYRTAGIFTVSEKMQAITYNTGGHVDELEAREKLLGFYARGDISGAYEFMSQALSDRLLEPSDLETVRGEVARTEKLAKAARSVRRSLINMGKKEKAREFYGKYSYLIKFVGFSNVSMEALRERESEELRANEMRDEMAGYLKQSLA